MRNRYYIAACLAILTVGMVAIAFPEGAASLLVVLVLSTAAILIFRRYTDEKEFITTVFLAALLIRLAFGVFIHSYELRQFFGGDALTYDFNGWRLVEYWTSSVTTDDMALQRARSMTGPGWGMNNKDGGIY